MALAKPLGGASVGLFLIKDAGIHRVLIGSALLEVSSIVERATIGVYCVDEER
jgi:hypothetical protein